MPSPAPSSKALHLTLWITQAFLALLYFGAGIFKLVTPIATIAALWPWAGAYPSLVRATALLDMAGGIGIVLPALTGIRPRLTVLAALGLVALQAMAIAFHLSRGEAANTPFNFFLLALALFVLWGRWSKAPLPQHA